MTPDELNEIRADLEAMPALPWKQPVAHRGEYVVLDTDGVCVADSDYGRVAEFISRAPERISVLISEIEGLKEALVNEQTEREMSDAYARDLEAKAAAWDALAAKYPMHQKWCKVDGPQFKPCLKCIMEQLLAKHSLSEKKEGAQ